MPQGPYHILPIVLLLVLSYLVSLLSVRLQLTGQARHRRFWNMLLLLFFLSATLLGLFLAIKVNYKLNIPWIDPVMRWHVDLGIGLAVVALFHLTWHLGYYKKTVTQLHGKSREEPLIPYLEFSPLQVRFLFVLLGFITMITQLALLKEYIKSLHGNELVIGIFLALWMVMTAAGARAGASYRAKISGESLLKFILLLSGLPVIIYLLLIWMTRFFLLPGMVPGILASMSLMVLIMPFTLVSGFLFAYLSRSVLSKRVDASYYMLDSLGSLSGGILFGLVLVFFLDNIQVLVLLFLVTSALLILLFRYPVTRGGRWIAVAVPLAALGSCWHPGPGTDWRACVIRAGRSWKQGIPPMATSLLLTGMARLPGTWTGIPWSAHMTWPGAKNRSTTLPCNTPLPLPSWLSEGVYQE